MTKTVIDYSKTIIYKIVCKDLKIEDVYVGHTTNFTKRKNVHKCMTNNCKDIHSKFKIYEAIRNNGGVGELEYVANRRIQM